MVIPKLICESRVTGTLVIIPSGDPLLWLAAVQLPSQLRTSFIGTDIPTCTSCCATFYYLDIVSCGRYPVFFLRRFLRSYTLQRHQDASLAFGRGNAASQSSFSRWSVWGGNPHLLLVFQVFHWGRSWNGGAGGRDSPQPATMPTHTVCCLFDMPMPPPSLVGHWIVKRQTKTMSPTQPVMQFYILQQDFDVSCCCASCRQL
ncbi:hypothetical protein F5B17DRAFT_400857 [Nemania serpens]|nr:hypothetical protein F5B17DRAFT_400857 [Nemania serpens]